MRKWVLRVYDSTMHLLFESEPKKVLVLADGECQDGHVLTEKVPVILLDIEGDVIRDGVIAISYLFVNGNSVGTWQETSPISVSKGDRLYSHFASVAASDISDPLCYLNPSPRANSSSLRCTCGTQNTYDKGICSDYCDLITGISSY